MGNPDDCVVQVVGGMPSAAVEEAKIPAQYSMTVDEAVKLEVLSFVISFSMLSHVIDAQGMIVAFFTVTHIVHCVTTVP